MALESRRLHDSLLASLPTPVARPVYDRHAVSVGIVHFGPGAFHRAHQAWFIEKLLADDPRWGISAVSLRSTEVRDALAPQHNLYTLALRGDAIRYQVIGAIREILVAPESPQAVLQRLASPATRVVTATVTEKGYCLTGEGLLNFSAPEIAHDLAHPRVPSTLIGFLVEGLRLRRAAGLAPFVAMSCDNLPDNGAKLARATLAFARETDPDLARWIDGEAHFPCTMVDSITPATTDELRRQTFDALHVHDQWPVQREAFAQWVIEAHESPGGPDWQSAGITLTNDVAAFDRAKLRVVNGLHSTLAYLGLLLGHRTVFEATCDTSLVTFLGDLLRHDIQPTLTAPRGMDLDSYARDVLARFKNPNLRHELAQIAWDGSQKLPPRISHTIEDALRAGRPADRLCVPVAAWMRFVRRAAKRGDTLVDPLAGELLRIGSTTTGIGADDIPRFLALRSVFAPSLIADPRFVRPLTAIYDGKDTPELTLPESFRKALCRDITRDDP